MGIPAMPDSPGAASASPVGEGQRIETLDVLRGFALLGILTMNITLGQPGATRLNPTIAGGFTGVNFAFWVAGFLLFDEKMISLFSMLFGAGLVLMTGRVAAAGMSPATFFYRRAGVLLLIGLAHAYLIWEGDILVTYALCGMLLYPLRHLAPKKLALFALLVWLPSVPLTLGFSAFLDKSREAAERAPVAVRTSDPATADQVKAWEGARAAFSPGPAEVEESIRQVRASSWLEMIPQRAPQAFAVQTTLFGASLGWTAGGRMLLGMALMKLGVFAGSRPAAFYLRMALAGYGLGYPLVVWAGYRLVKHNFDPVLLFGGDIVINAAGSVPVALGHAGVLLWLCVTDRLKPLTRRLAALGRMALTNYLMQSLLCTTLFYGYGFGLYGALDRVQLYGAVAAVWALQLWYSPLWLQYFRFGPAEWLWRSVTYGKAQPFRAAARV